MQTIEDIRKEFIILTRKINDKELIYLDNAATTQKPISVVESLIDYYFNYNANIHRGVHTLSQEATQKYETARTKIQQFINAKKSSEIVFTSGTTHAINLIANGFASILKERDEVLVLESEHHSNIVPWQFLCQRTGAKLRSIPLDEQGMIRFDEFEKMLCERVKIISCQHISNVLGNVHSIEKIIEMGHKIGAAVVIDAAQSTAHYSIDVQKLNPDFLVSSGHKMYAPTGIGFLYGKEEWLEKLPPYQGGGEMVHQVQFEETSFACLPHKFEAGTPNIAGGIGLGAAIDFINKLGLDFIAKHEHSLLKYATEQLNQIEDLHIYGTTNLDQKSAVISFNINNIHSYDIGTILNHMGIAIRTGHHCAQPTMNRFGLSGTARASFAIYNTFEEIDKLVEGIKKAKKMLL